MLFYAGSPSYGNALVTSTLDLKVRFAEQLMPCSWMSDFFTHIRYLICKNLQKRLCAIKYYHINKMYKLYKLLNNQAHLHIHSVCLPQVPEPQKQNRGVLQKVKSIYLKYSCEWDNIQFITFPSKINEN